MCVQAHGQVENTNNDLYNHINDMAWVFYKVYDVHVKSNVHDKAIILQSVLHIFMCYILQLILFAADIILTYNLFISCSLLAA